MRPKKVILCVDDNEQELSVLKFTLATEWLSQYGGYQWPGGDCRFFRRRRKCDLVLADTNMPQMSGIQLAERLKRMRSHVPMLLLGDAQAAGGEMHLADAVMARKNCSSLELLERVKVMSARKRGPRKGAQRIPQDDALAAAS